MADFISQLSGPEMDNALQEVNAHNAEAWSSGTRGGVQVKSGDPTYDNNAKYWAGVAKSAVPAGSNAAVLWNQPQTLSEANKATARNNIGAGNPASTVAGGKNLVNVYNSVNALLSGTDGSASPSGQWLTTDFIEVQGGQTYVGSIESATDNFVVRFCEYNSNKVFLRNTDNPIGVTGNTTRGFNLLSNTKYVRISFGRNNKVTTVADYVNSGHWLQLELGNTATPYEPFYESGLQLTNLFASLFAQEGKELTSANDMNTVFEGMYRQGGPNLPANSPANANNAIVIVIKRKGGASYANDIYFQLWFSHNQNAIFVRSMVPASSIYNPWVKL